MAVEPVITFLPYQKAWIEDKSRFKIGMFTRRGGKTFGTCGEAVIDCIDHEIEGGKTRWTILSRSEGTAKEAIDEAVRPMTKAFYEVKGTLRGSPEFTTEDFHVPAHAREVIENGVAHMIDVPEATYKAQEVRFPGGSRITAISASPDAARGFGGNLILDEFAFHRDSRRIWASAFPVAIRNGNRIRIISTPNGKGNKFHEIMTTKDNNWSKHHIDIYEAVKQGLDVDPEELRKALNDEDAWNQEFLLHWMDASSAWLPYDLISSCEHVTAGHPALYRGGPCFVGVDIAARNDLFVIWVLELVDGATGHARNHRRETDQVCAPGRTAGRRVPPLPRGPLLHGPNRHGRKTGRGRPGHPRGRSGRRGSVQRTDQTGSCNGLQREIRRACNPDP